MDCKPVRASLLAGAVLFVLVAVNSAGAQQAGNPVTSGDQLPVPGKPVPADHFQLSEHNVEWMLKQEPQAQMEFLLSSAINHDHGSTDWIEKLVEGWRGKLKPTQKWQDLQDTALYSNDLRVRAAAIEINLAVYNLSKTDETADRLIRSGETPGNRPFVGWELGMLANRGVQLERIHQLLVTYIHEPDEKTRFWAVEGLAHLGTDDTIKDFLDVLRSDASMDVRERAGCSLAKSGMLTREQRMKAVPGLIDLADDNSLNAVTRTWVFQALREISNQPLPNDSKAWRSWYEKFGASRTQEFRQGEKWSVLGNS
ncbi:MAG: HEAT repeat domain-containing protein [Acidobacteriia bacterium]|nr:HEAT repeat domain-containing protein [Terriglobia bacterium]